MDEDRFWKVIAGAGGNATNEAAPDRLRKSLDALRPDEIERFQAHWDRISNDLYRWDLWGAAFVINGGCSDDCFDYFRCYLIAHGREVVGIAMRDPDELASTGIQVGDDPEWEEFCYAADDAYEAQTGKSLPMSRVEQQPEEPLGQKWREDEVTAQFPKLAKRFG